MMMLYFLLDFMVYQRVDVSKKRTKFIKSTLTHRFYKQNKHTQMNKLASI